jgi:hypothetical protein
VHTAQLRLRSTDGPLSAQLVWPAARVTAVMVLLLDAGEPDAEPVRRAVSAPGVLSLSAACRRGHELEDGVRSIEWTADHAAQLGAEGAGLILAGLHAGAAVVATLAVRARDDGWPDVMHQLLIEPRFGAAPSPTTPLGGVAPATMIGGDEGSRAYALRLRQAGVPVMHVRHADLAGRLAEVIGVPALRHSPDGPAP